MEGIDPIPRAAPHFAGTAASAGNWLKHNLELITQHRGDNTTFPSAPLNFRVSGAQFWQYFVSKSNSASRHR
jgi:hypothetical protein